MVNKYFVNIMGLWMQRKLESLQFRWRVFWNIRVKKKLKTMEPDGAIVPATIKHNLKSLYQRNDRMNSLIKPLGAIETIGENSSVLIIGPRNENDLFLLAKEGFRNVRGLDLISYSPYIDLGDMHKLHEIYGDSKFDVVLCGWTISYTSNPILVAQQIIKVCKPNGIVGIGLEYANDDPNLDKEWEKQDGYILIDRSVLPKRVNSVSSILELFKNNLGEVFFSHDAPLKLAHLPGKMLPKASSVVTIFSIKK